LPYLSFALGLTLQVSVKNLTASKCPEIRVLGTYINKCIINVFHLHRIQISQFKL